MKVDNEIKNEVVAMFHSYCNQLATLVNDQLFDGCRDWSWIGDEVGGMCDFEESDVLSPEDMVRILKHNISYDDYAAWREANLESISSRGSLACAMICLMRRILKKKIIHKNYIVNITFF